MTRAITIAEKQAMFDDLRLHLRRQLDSAGGLIVKDETTCFIAALPGIKCTLTLDENGVNVRYDKECTPSA